MTTHDILTDGIAALATEVDGGLQVHGVILGSGDVTSGLSGKRTRWPADILESMVGLPDGKPITMADSLDPEQHVGVELTEDGPRLTGAVSMDEKVGEITSTAFEADVGILFEGFLADWEAEDVVESGLAQVSPVIARELELVEGEEGEDDALYEPTEVTAFRDLALVADGAAPSNDIRVGGSPDMTATAEALTSHFDVEVEVLADGGMEVTNTGGDDGPDGSDGQSTPASDWRTTMSKDDLTDKERELLAAAGQKDDPMVVEAEVPERLTELEETTNEHEDLLSEADGIEDPVVQEADEAEALSEFRSFFKEALAEQKDVDPEMLKNDVEALTSEFRDDEGDLDIEALTQSPETGSGPADGDDRLDLSDEEREEIEAMQRRIEHWEGNNETIVQAEKEALTELVGADSFDDIDLEAL